MGESPPLPSAPPKPPIPTRAIKLASLGVGVFCLLSMSALLREVATGDNTAERVVTGCFSLVLMVLAFQQYRGVFHVHLTGVYMAQTLLFITAGALLFSAIILLYLELSVLFFSQRFLLVAPTRLPMVLAMFAAGIAAIQVIRMNSRWARQIIASEYVPNLKQYALSDIMVLMTAMAMVLSLTKVGIERPEGTWLGVGKPYAENISADRVPLNLPAGASYVSYGYNYQGDMACEFTIAEEELRQWIAEDSSRSSTYDKLEPIDSFSGITCYAALSKDVDGMTHATFVSGYEYAQASGNRFEKLIYTPQYERAYYYTGPRER